MSHHKSKRRACHGGDAPCAEPARSAGLLGLLLLVGTALLGGCATTAVRAPLDPEALAQIKLGETTGAEVMRLLGPPHSIIRGSASFREAGSPGRCLHGQYYSYARDRQLSSLDDEHYVLFYKYSKTEGRSIALCIADTSSERRRVRIESKELLIIVARDGDVVVDVASNSGESAS